MRFFSRVVNHEKGQILLLSLVILLVGFVIMTPLLSFVGTSVKSTRMYQNKMNQTYACNAGIEDASFKMIKNNPSLESLDYGDSWAYTLPSVNGLPVTVSITSLCLLDGILGEDEYKIGQPHTGWVELDVPAEEVVRNYEEDWVEYSCNLDFTYDGSGNRMVESVGVYFAPFPGVIEMVQGPYDEAAVPAMTFTDLESTETKATVGGFAFIYRWEDNSGPVFSNKNRTGSLSFKFKIMDADWSYTSSFMWATFKEQDISYVTNSQLYKWLIQSSSGQVSIIVEALEDESEGSVKFLSWEQN